MIIFANGTVHGGQQSKQYITFRKYNIYVTRARIVCSPYVLKPYTKSTEINEIDSNCGQLSLFLETSIFIATLSYCLP